VKALREPGVGRVVLLGLRRSSSLIVVSVVGSMVNSFEKELWSFAIPSSDSTLVTALASPILSSSSTKTGLSI